MSQDIREVVINFPDGSGPMGTWIKEGNCWQFKFAFERIEYDYMKHAIKCLDEILGVLI